MVACVFLSKNICAENSSDPLFQNVYYILFKNQFSALLSKGLGKEEKTLFCGYLSQSVLNTLCGVAKTQAAEGRENAAGHRSEPCSFPGMHCALADPWSMRQETLCELHSTEVI